MWIDANKLVLVLRLCLKVTKETKKINNFVFFHLRVLRARFYDKRDAEDALEAMDGRMLDGRELRVQMARYGRPSSPQTRRNGDRDRDRSSRRGGDRRRSRDRERRRSRSRSRGRRSFSRSRSRSESKSSRGRSTSPVHKKASISRSRSKGRSVSRSPHSRSNSRD